MRALKNRGTVRTWFFVRMMVMGFWLLLLSTSRAAPSNLMESHYGKDQDNYHMIVAKDGTGDFTSIQEAINSAKAFPYQRVIIEIKNGVYREKVRVYAWNPMVSLIGESRDSTVITYDDYFDKIDLGRNSTFHSATVQVDGDDFYATNLTIENSAGPVGQAVALAITGNRVKVEHCRLLGHQDTLYTAGAGSVHYFADCYIEGTVDFIFGAATVFFENCILHSKSNSYITAASTPEGMPYGYVFKQCRLTADEGVTEVYLGRPWRTYAKTVFLDCHMGDHVVPEGWDNWSNPEAEGKSFYAEWNSIGPGARMGQRVAWSHRLSASEAAKYTKENILRSHHILTKAAWYELDKKSE